MCPHLNGQTNIQTILVPELWSTTDVGDVLSFGFCNHCCIRGCGKSLVWYTMVHAFHHEVLTYINIFWAIVYSRKLCSHPRRKQWLQKPELRTSPTSFVDHTSGTSTVWILVWPCKCEHINNIDPSDFKKYNSELHGGKHEPFYIRPNFSHIHECSNGCRNQNLEHPLHLLWIIVRVPVLFGYWSDHANVNTSII